MAVLSDSDRAACWREWMDENVETCGIVKADLRAAIDAADSWANSNAASFNTALPVPARTTLSSAQKAAILAYVIVKRWKVGA